MRSIAFFSLLCLLVACNMLFGGCAVTKEVKFLAEEAYIPATKATIDTLSDSGSVVLDATVSSNPNILIDLLNVRTITFTGMTAGHKFMYVAKDNTRKERTVQEDGTFSIKMPKHFAGVNVFYGYTEYRGRWIYLKNPADTYQWNATDTTFHPVPR